MDWYRQRADDCDDAELKAGSPKPRSAKNSPAAPTSQASGTSPHQLRHTYGTTLELNAGVSRQALMALLGHVSAEMSLRYAHLFDAPSRAAFGWRCWRSRKFRWPTTQVVGSCRAGRAAQCSLRRAPGVVGEGWRARRPVGGSGRRGSRASSVRREPPWIPGRLKAHSVAEDDCLDAVAGAGLGEGVSHVGLDGCLAENEAGCDLVIRRRDLGSPGPGRGGSRFNILQMGKALPWC